MMPTASWGTAARIQGDSDSVAALTGDLLGAALGPGAIPAAWRETLPRRQVISDLAQRLVALGNDEALESAHD